MIKLEKEQTARFAARLEQETQESVMRDIAQFSEADIVDTWASEPPACAEVHAMVFNMERGVHIDEAIEFLKDNPSLQPFDLILANELDFGTARSGEKNTAEEVAKALGLSYVFGLEFIELKDAALGFHGNAVFSRWPVKWAEVFRLPEQYNWYNDRQKRIGGRCAILAKLDVHGREVGVASIHLENRTDGEGRRVQMQAVLDEGYITNVAVRPDCRKQGVAGKLLQVFLDFAQANHLAFLTLEVRASNYGAIALYGSRGFRSVGRRKNYYEHPKEDAIIMTKEFEHGAENADTGTVADGVRS